ncbi:MAG TPA: DNA-3-methyladenine glycosylase 2 family protein [Planctomycetes bacterium]|nr:DNA-3-methyladenine glycosylase 2 family protein [Planctomycetota bacterium]
MADVIRRIGHCQLKRRGGRFDVLARSILSQQISVQAARTIRRRLQRLLPGGRLSATGIDRLSDDQLQSVGISLQKRGYLRNLTGHVLDGTVSFRRLARIPDEAVIAELTAVKGVGRWTAQMFLLSGLGRPDIFAPDDLGLKNAMRALYGLGAKPSTEQLEAIAENWAPYRSVASWYLWRSLDMPLNAE